MNSVDIFGQLRILRWTYGWLRWNFETLCKLLEKFNKHLEQYSGSSVDLKNCWKLRFDRKSQRSYTWERAHWSMYLRSSPSRRVLPARYCRAQAALCSCTGGSRTRAPGSRYSAGMPPETAEDDPVPPRSESRWFLRNYLNFFGNPRTANPSKIEILRNFVSLGTRI